MGINVAPQVGSIFNEAVRDNTAKRWNGVAARRTTRSDATNHRRYQVTGKSLDAAGCTGEPLLVLAETGYFCAFCTVAWPSEGFSWPPWRPRWEIIPGEVQKILYRNRCGVRFGAHNAPDGEEAHNPFWEWEQIAPLLAYVEEAVVGLRTLLRTLYSPVPVVPTCCCCVSGTLLRGVGVALFVVPRKGL